MTSSIEGGLSIDQQVNTSVSGITYKTRLSDRLREIIPNKQRMLVVLGGLALLGGSLFIGVRNIDAAVNLINNPTSDVLYKIHTLYPGQVEHTHRPYFGQYIFK